MRFGNSDLSLSLDLLQGRVVSMIPDVRGSILDAEVRGHLSSWLVQKMLELQSKGLGSRLRLRGTDLAAECLDTWRV